MPDIPTTVPAAMRAGDKIEWKIALTDYPASTYSLKYYLVKDGNQLVISANADGDGHAVVIEAATSAGYAAGIYSYMARVDDGSNGIYTVDEGKIEVLPNFETETAGFDNRPHVKKVLDALEAIILNKASKDQLSYSIAGRSISRLSPSELIEWRDAYKTEYLRLEREAGRGRPSTIQVRF